MTDAAFVTPPLAIDQAFLDHNGHVNMAYHLVLADQALDLSFQRLKGADYVDGRGMTTFAVELHVRYLAEINADDDVRGRVRWVENDDKRAHWTVELIRGDGAVLTCVEGISLSISLDTRRAAAFPDDVRGRIETAVERDRPGAAELDWLGRSVSMRRNGAA